MAECGKWLAALAVVMTVAVLCSGTEAAVYKVGDSIGWTVLNSPNYTAWAESKRFKVGDVLVFEYNKKFHNVLEVSKSDYKNCVTTSPKVTYNTGNDSVTLKHSGHHYFICGFPGHCAGGQKVDVRIAKTSSAAPSQAPMASPASSPAPSNTGVNGAITAPSPSASKGNDAAAVLKALFLAAAFAGVSVGVVML